MPERIYKITSFTTGHSRAGQPYTSSSIRIPAQYAHLYRHDARFTCIADERSIRYELVASSLADQLRAVATGTLADRVMLDEVVVEQHRRCLQIATLEEARADLRRLLGRARVSAVPDWCDAPRDGAALLIVDGWMALVVAARDPERVQYRGPYPKPFAAIARRQTNLRELDSIDALTGWALARSVRPIRSVRARADQQLGSEYVGWEAIVAAVAATGVVGPDRPAWVAPDRSGARWITASLAGRELALCVRPNHFADGDRFVAVSLELRPALSIAA